MPSTQFRPKVFVSYSHRDRDLKEKFDDNLQVLKEQGIIDFWTDGEIQAGDHWPDEIANAMNEANLILFLVSNHFLASSFIRNKEAPMAMVRQNKGQAVIVPIILRKTPGWQKEEWNTLQALPSQVKPVDHPDWRSAENAFAEVEERLRELIEDLPQKLSKQAAQWRSVSQGHEVKTASTSTEDFQTSKALDSDKSLSFVWFKWLGIAATFALVIGALVYLKPKAIPLTSTNQNEAPSSESKLVVVPSEKTPARLLLFCSDGKTPLEGATVAARRAEDKGEKVNGICFDIVTESLAVAAVESGYMTLEYSAVETLSTSADGRMVVDPDAFQTDPSTWKPVVKVPKDQGTDKTHSSIIGASPPRVKASRVGGNSTMELYVGKRGRIPAGLLPVTLKYRDKSSSELLAEANFSLEIASATWDMPPDHRKVKLYTRDGKLELDKTIIETTQRVSKINWSAQDDEYEQKQFAFQPLTLADDSLIGHSFDLRVYALNARYSDEVSSGVGNELVISSSQRQSLPRIRLPQGNFIEIYRNRSWRAGRSAQKDQWVTYFSEKNAQVPDGIHELGITCEHEGEILYRSKIKMHVEDRWVLPESETKLVLRDTNGTDIEKGPVIEAFYAKEIEWGGWISTMGLVFPFVVECKGEELNGPWGINFYFKKANLPHDMVIGFKPMQIPTREGYVYCSSIYFPINEKKKLSPGEVVNIPTGTLYIGNNNPIHNGQGKIPPGIHEVGIEIVDQSKDLWSVIYRGSVRLKAPE